MKKNAFSGRTVSFLIALLFFSSCSKFRDYIIQHPSDIGKHCKIESLALNSSNTPITHVQFIYNSAGDPREMRPMDVLYGPDLHFRYDKKGRLSDVLQTDPGQTFVYLWSVYSYPSSKLIIDSTYEYQGNVNDPHPPNTPGMNISILRMQLDDAGRPVKFLRYSSDTSIPPNSSETSYDRNGNAIAPGILYDDKINIYQTSKTWQLYFLDFSRNNRTVSLSSAGPTTPASYDEFGLPTKFLGPSWPVFGYSFNTMDIAMLVICPRPILID